MKFQVGRFACEMSLDDTGKVVTTWWPEVPKYLDAADRRQYRAGRDAFLHATGKLAAPLGSQAGSWRALRRLAPVVAVAVGLAGCAHGGGIGLEAMVADHNCEQAGYQLGTPQYAACRMAAQQQSAMNAAAMQAFYARQADLAAQQGNRQQNCTYYGSNIGGWTGGTMSCR
jgi:hypothetical protein